MAEELEQELRLHVAGGIATVNIGTTSVLIYEPIGKIGDRIYYIWTLDGKRGKSEIRIKGEKNERKEYYIEIEGRSYYFKGKPIDVDHDILKEAIVLPDISDINTWLSGSIKPLTNQEVYKLLQDYFSMFGEYEESYHSDIIAIYVLQTHLLPLLDVVFNLSIEGPYGSGKTAVLKLMRDVAYHGLLADSVSAPFRVRFTEYFNPSWFQDELDATEKDDFGRAIIRTSYERGSYYGRWNVDTNQPELLAHFGPQAYTLVEEPDDPALSSRSLAKIVISKSRSFRVPVINSVRSKFARPIATQLFFWRFEFLNNAFHNNEGLRDKVELKPENLLNGKLNPDSVRREIYENLTARFTPKEKALLTKLLGRDNQLAYVALKIANLLGIDIVESLREAINIKLEEEKSHIEARFAYFINLLRIEIDKKRGTINTPDSRKVMLSQLTEGLATYCKEHNIKEPRTRTLSSWLIDLGFRSGKTKKHTREGIALYLLDGIIERIESRLDYEEIRKEDIEQRTLEP